MMEHAQHPWHLFRLRTVDAGDPTLANGAEDRIPVNDVFDRMLHGILRPSGNLELAVNTGDGLSDWGVTHFVSRWSYGLRQRL